MEREEPPEESTSPRNVDNQNPIWRTSLYWTKRGLRYLHRGTELCGKHPFATGLFAILSLFGFALSIMGYLNDQSATDQAINVEVKIDKIKEAMDGAQSFSDPESDLSRLAIAYEKLLLSDVQGYIKHFRFEPWIDRGSFTTYILYAGSVDPSEGPRIILFFSKVGLCAALHLKDIDLNSDAVEQSAATGGYKITYTSWCYHDDEISKELSATYYPILRHAD